MKNHRSPATPSTIETHKLERQSGIENGKRRGRERVIERRDEEHERESERKRKKIIKYSSTLLQ